MNLQLMEKQCRFCHIYPRFEGDFISGHISVVIWPMIHQQTASGTRSQSRVLEVQALFKGLQIPAHIDHWQTCYQLPLRLIWVWMQVWVHVGVIHPFSSSNVHLSVMLAVVLVIQGGWWPLDLWLKPSPMSSCFPTDVNTLLQKLPHLHIHLRTLS